MAGRLQLVVSGHHLEWEQGQACSNNNTRAAKRLVATRLQLVGQGHHWDLEPYQTSTRHMPQVWALLSGPQALSSLAGHSRPPFRLPRMVAVPSVDGRLQLVAGGHHLDLEEAWNNCCTRVTMCTQVQAMLPCTMLEANCLAGHSRVPFTQTGRGAKWLPDWR